MELYTVFMHVACHCISNCDTQFIISNFKLKLEITDTIQYNFKHHATKTNALFIDLHQIPVQRPYF